MLAAASQVGNNVVIARPDGGSVRLNAFSLGSLDASDLFFTL